MGSGGSEKHRSPMADGSDLLTKLAELDALRKGQFA